MSPKLAMWALKSSVLPNQNWILIYLLTSCKSWKMLFLLVAVIWFLSSIERMHWSLFFGSICYVSNIHWAPVMLSVLYYALEMKELWSKSLPSFIWTTEAAFWIVSLSSQWLSSNLVSSLQSKWAFQNKNLFVPFCYLKFSKWLHFGGSKTKP